MGMEIFARVVEAGSFTAAADKLGLSRAAVSKRIMQLETHLGVRLLNRTTRRVAPTEIGLAYYDRCTRVLADVAEANQLVSRLHSEPRGTLKINAPMSFGTLHLGPAIVDFAASFPELRIGMTLNDRFIDMFDEGYDVAIRIAREADTTLMSRRIAPIRLVLCASPAYVAAHGAPQHPSDLVRHSCLHYSYFASGDEWRFTGPDSDHAVKVAGPLSANNGDVLRQAALRGLGLTLIPSFLASSDLLDGRLLALMLDYRPQELSLLAVYLPSRRLSKKVTLLIEFLAERFGPEPYWDNVPTTDASAA